MHIAGRGSDGDRALLVRAANSRSHFSRRRSIATDDSPYWWAFLLGLLQAQWTYTGFDASAHMAEETADPRRRRALGHRAVGRGLGRGGLRLLIALTLAIQTHPGCARRQGRAGQPIPAVIAILQTGAGREVRQRHGGAGVDGDVVLRPRLASPTLSRGIYSLARDNGTPFAPLVPARAPKFGTPGPAIWSAAVATLLLMAWSGAVPVVTSLATVAVYLGLRDPGDPGPALAPPAGPWTLGRWSRPVAFVAIAYAVFISSCS